MKLSTSLINQFSLMHGRHKRVIHGDSVWVIGDVHGCSNEFRSLCQQIRDKYPDAKIIQLGDLIDRGYEIIDVFRVLEEYQVVTTIGNHELNFLQERAELKKCGSHARRTTHEVFDHYSQPTQQAIMQHLQSAYNAIIVPTAERNFVLSHAPRRNNHLPVSEENAWTWCARTEPVYQDEFDFYVVHGHQQWNYLPIEDQIKNIDVIKSLNVDSGCVYGRELVAVELNTLETMSVASAYNCETVENGEKEDV